MYQQFQLSDRDYNESLSYDLSPDGRLLAFSGRTARHNSIFVLDMAAYLVRQLTHGDGFHDTDPAFSPDGRRLVFARRDRQYSSLFEIGIPGAKDIPGTSGPTRLISNQRVYDVAPSFSRDGTEVVFARAARRYEQVPGIASWDTWDLHILSRATGAVRRVTQKGFYQISPPFFVPGTGKVVIHAQTFGADGGERIYLVENYKDAKPRLRPLWKAVSVPHPSAKGDRLVGVGGSMTPDDYTLCTLGLSQENRTTLRVPYTYFQYPRFAQGDTTVWFLFDAARDGRYGLAYTDLNRRTTVAFADYSLFADPLRWRPGKATHRA
jgi:Tol biopolymer transport system component